MDRALNKEGKAKLLEAKKSILAGDYAKASINLREAKIASSNPYQLSLKTKWPLLSPPNNAPSSLTFLVR